MKRKKENPEELKPSGLTSLLSKPQSCIKEEIPTQKTAYDMKAATKE